MSMRANRKRDVPRNGLRPVAAPQRNGRPEQRGRRSPVISEELFSHLLVRERKRSDRSNRSFILLSLKAKDCLDLASSPAGEAALDALAGGMRETDLLGCVKWPTVIG